MHILSKSRSGRILLIVVCSEISTLAPSHRGAIERVAADVVPVPRRRGKSPAQTNGCCGKFSLSSSKVTLTALLTNGEKGCAGGVKEVLQNKNRRHPDASFKRGWGGWGWWQVKNKKSTFCTQRWWNTETALCEQIAVAAPSLSLHVSKRPPPFPSSPILFLPPAYLLYLSVCACLSFPLFLR